uniref:Uncharacterized protein n=1 Tax=Aegilops tauschii subsp. strangulata TaxID=200361 RepID=A0A453PIZ2_AEGTS
IAVATATAASVVVAAGAADGEAEFDYRKLSGIIIPGFASTQLRAWSVLDCPYSPFDFNLHLGTAFVGLKLLPR